VEDAAGENRRAAVQALSITVLIELVRWVRKRRTQEAVDRTAV